MGLPGRVSTTPYHGITVVGESQGQAMYSGKWTMYRFHIEDPVLFDKSIKVTIEHGPRQRARQRLSPRTAYWYQSEPHAPFPALLPVDKRLPISGMGQPAQLLEDAVKRIIGTKRLPVRDRTE